MTPIAVARSVNRSAPNPLTTAWHVYRATRTPPSAPRGTGTVDHSMLRPVLEAVRAGGVPALDGVRQELADYLGGLADIDPDQLEPEQALAFWINLYNAAALGLIADANTNDRSSVLDIKHAFDRPAARITGQDLSLTEIEHGKVRRFKDPRIHFALICGSVSCPTLRGRPFEGDAIGAQLQQQAVDFLAAGGAVADREADTLYLSRVFLWYGPDFVRPARMPGWLPASKRSTASAASAWMVEQDAAWLAESGPRIRYQRYDWGLACSVR